MPTACCPKCHRLGIAKIKTASQRLPVKDDINAVQWPHPTETAAAPSLTFRPGKLCQNIGDNIAKQRGCIGTSDMATGKEKPPFRGIFFGQRLARQTG